MKKKLIFQTVSVTLILFLSTGVTTAADSGLMEDEIDWLAFIATLIAVYPCFIWLLDELNED